MVDPSSDLGGKCCVRGSSKAAHDAMDLLPTIVDNNEEASKGIATAASAAVTTRRRGRRSWWKPMADDAIQK